LKYLPGYTFLFSFLTLSSHSPAFFPTGSAGGTGFAERLKLLFLRLYLPVAVLQSQKRYVCAMNIVITGASRGIGKAVAARFIRAGWDAALCSLHPERMLAAKEELSGLNGKSTIVAEAVDMGDREQVQAFAVRVTEAFGAVDVLVNNAGIFVPGSVHEEEPGALERTMAVNLYGAYYLTRALLPPMKSRGRGHVFNMCSTAGLKAYPNGGSYSISKFALLGFSRNLREEMKPFGVRVTAVSPGPVLTDSWAGFEGPPERMMRPEDIAEVVWSAFHLSAQTVVEDIVLRPVEGDMP
jgi:NAD(P)-dependent dehydrogenase (short-subunit alcohol dehydrogenase family)